MEGFGTRTLLIYKFDPGIHATTREEAMRKPLTYEDAMAIRDLCPSVESVTVETFLWGPPSVVKYKGVEMLDASFSGPTPEAFRTMPAELKDGRFYTDADNLHRRDVAVLGADVVKRLFANEDPIGKTINVGGHNFEVIGTLDKLKQFLGENDSDRNIYTPYFTFRKHYPEAKENYITARAYPGKLEQAKDEVTGLLRRRRNVKWSEPDNFGISTPDAIIKEFREIMGKIVLVTILISSIGLMVGGIGVMNIMLVSVTERTREIGVRKAIGARRSDITWQFLLEAMSLTGAGGVMGILLGYTLSFLIRTLVPALPSTVPLWSAIAGFIVSVSIGLFFGLWPAVKASHLDPIVALRYE
jgi:ABC-type antimicrobial peptide transport system permease subunit